MYPFDKERLAALREILTASRGPDGLAPDAVRKGGRSARLSPQEAAFDRMWDNSEYRRLSFKVSCFERLEGLLFNDENMMLNLMFDGLTWQQTAAAMNLSVETCRKRKWPKIVMKAARLYFGELA
jgi:hypothetical protein